MERPLVSIVSVFHNRGGAVKESIESLLTQTYRNIEVIVVDDGSTDDTWDQLRELHDDRLIISTQSNHGFTSTILKAVRSARGEFVAIHGAGDISLPSRIARQAEVLANNPEVVVVGSFVNNEGKAQDKSNLSYAGRPIPLSDTYKASRITHGEVMIRKDVFDLVGGYRPFFQYAQDHDLWLRLDEVGLFWIIPEVLYHRKRFTNAVNSSMTKLALQAFYGNFAEACSAKRGISGTDYLDDYGNAGAFLVPGSAKLARKLLVLAFRALLAGDTSAANLIAHASVGQRTSLATLTSYSFTKMAVRWPKVWHNAFLPMINRILKRRT